MKYLLLDTCVWINLFSRPKLSSVSEKLIEMLDNNTVSIVMPDIIQTEINKHRDTLEDKYVKATISSLKNAKTVLKDYSGNEVDQCKELLDNLIATLGQGNDYVLTSNEKIEKILSHRNTIHTEISQEHHETIVGFGINKKAPFHSNKNSVADAVIVCALKDILQVYPGEVIFVSENKSDFSDTQDDRVLHPDITGYLNSEVEYSLNIADVINGIIPESVSEEVIEIVAESTNRNACERHEFEDGCWRPSRYGGLTWHQICKKCGTYLDTGESYD